MAKESEFFSKLFGNADYWRYLEDWGQRAAFWEHRRSRWVQELSDLIGRLQSMKGQDWMAVSLFWVRLHGVVGVDSLFVVGKQTRQQALDRLRHACASLPREEAKLRDLPPGRRRGQALSMTQAAHEMLVAGSEMLERLTDKELILINYFRDVECHPRLDSWGLRFVKGRLKTHAKGKAIEDLNRAIVEAIAPFGGDPVRAAVVLAAKICEPAADLHRAFEALTLAKSRRNQ